MSRVDMHECDHCKRRVDNGYAERGWIRIGGSVSRAHGHHDGSCYVTDYINKYGQPLDFCGLGCLEKALDGAAGARRVEPKEEVRGAR